MARYGFVVSLILLLASVVFNPIPLISQNQPPTRDPQALKIVQTAIHNLSATNSATAIQDCVLTGTSESDSNPDLRKEFTWTIAGNEFRFDVKNSKGRGVFISGHGSPVNVSSGKTTKINYHVAKANVPYYIPGLLLSRELANPNFSVKFVGVAVVGGQKTIQAHLENGSDKLSSLVTPQDWYFDPSSGLPLRVEFRIPTNENAADWVKGVYDFSNFRSVDRVLTPFTILFTRQRMRPQVITFSSVTFNTGISPSVFDTPGETE
jgi:hypothetical protein